MLAVLANLLLLRASALMLGEPEPFPLRPVSSFHPPQQNGQSYSILPPQSKNLWFKRKTEAPGTLKCQGEVFDMDKATIMAQFASTAYCSKSNNVIAWNCSRCLKTPEFRLTSLIEDKAWDVSGYVGYYPPWKAKVVIFRGTHGSDVKNWIENLKFSQHRVRLDISFPGSEKLLVHNGFSRIWNIPFKDRVIAAVKVLEKEYGDGPLYIGGHSAGGATAQLAAFHFRMKEGYKDIHLYTFGSPRVGNWAFAAKLTEIMTESWRFTHNRDIVPTVPWMIMGFWHMAREVHQREIRVSLGNVYTEYHVCDGTGEDPSGHNSQCAFFGCTIDDHYVYLYTIMENDGTC